MQVTVTIELDERDLRTIARDMGRSEPVSLDDIQWWVRTTVLAGLAEARQDHCARELHTRASYTRTNNGETQ